MKRTITALSLLLTLLLLLSACGTDPSDPWSNATYTRDTTLGEGAKAVTVEVAVNDHLITFTIKTDADVLGDALFDSGLCTGEEGPYGLYVKYTNGIMADYNVNQKYWALYIDGEYALTGVDSTPITEGTVYRLAYE
jgi:hypothetical protein